MVLCNVTEHRPTHEDIVIHASADVAPANNDDDDDDDDGDVDNTVLVRENKEHDENDTITIDTDADLNNGNRDSESEKSVVILDDDDDDNDDDEDDGCDCPGKNQSNNPRLECLLPNFHFSFVSTTKRFYDVNLSSQLIMVTKNWLLVPPFSSCVIFL